LVVSLLRTWALQQKTPYHQLNVHILELLQKEGYIRGFRVEGTKINILLKHYQGAPVIRNIRVVSKPSRDIWLTPPELKHRTRFNSGLWVMQTACGVVSHRDCIKMGIGGKVLLAVNNGYQWWCWLKWRTPHHILSSSFVLWMDVCMYFHDRRALDIAIVVKSANNTNQTI